MSPVRKKKKKNQTTSNLFGSSRDLYLPRYCRYTSISPSNKSSSSKKKTKETYFAHTAYLSYIIKGGITNLSVS